MTDKVNYEWTIETLDFYDGCGDNPDIIETIAFDENLQAALDYQDELNEPSRLVLVRQQGNETDGLTDRSWAYVTDDWTLPETFTHGAGEIGPRVPKRFHNRIRR